MKTSIIIKLKQQGEFLSQENRQKQPFLLQLTIPAAVKV